RDVGLGGRVRRGSHRGRGEGQQQDHRGHGGCRFVLVGVGLAFVCQSGIGYVITRSQVDDVRSALVWMVGSIGTPTWGAVGTLALCLAVLLPLAGYAGWRLRAMQLGDESAAGLGLRVTRSRLLVLGV